MGGSTFPRTPAVYISRLPEFIYTRKAGVDNWSGASQLFTNTHYTISLLYTYPKPAQKTQLAAEDRALESRYLEAPETPHHVANNPNRAY